MKQLTLRGIDPRLDSKLKLEARRRGQSVNKTAISLLQDSLGLSDSMHTTKAVYNDLDYLAGTRKRILALEIQQVGELAQDSS